MLVKACDPQETTLGLLKLYNALPEEYHETNVRNYTTSPSKRNTTRRKQDLERYEKAKEGMTKLMEEFQEQKAADEALQKTKAKAKVRRIQGASKTVTKNSTRLMRESSSLPRIGCKTGNKREIITMCYSSNSSSVKPAINDYNQVQGLYNDALQEMRRSNPSFLQHL